MPPNTALPSIVALRDPVFLGGRWDTLLNKFVGPCESWRTWCVGEKQFEILMGQRKTQHNLLYSAEGAGKTVLMAMWVWVQILLAAAAGIPGTIGATAPTDKRLGTFIKEVTNLGPVGTYRNPVPSQWGTINSADKDLRVVAGYTIQFRSTKKQSEEVGSPIQGWNWGLGCACDELQNSIAAFNDILMRLRSGPKAPIMATATAADRPAWRSFRDGLAAKYWTIHRITYLDTWAIHDSHWDMAKDNMSPREWQRRGLAMDVGPEAALYHSWLRDQNLLPLPAIGAKDVTAEVLARYGPNLHALLGHDPGAIQDVTEVLKAYQFKGEDFHRWYVVDEFRTERTTSEEHAERLMGHLQDVWGLMYDGDDQGRVLLRMDPYGTTDSKTDKSVYLTFRKAGFDPRSAAFKGQKGNGRIPKEARIEMVNTLLCNAKYVRRLYVMKNIEGQPCAPLLIESFELSERDAAGQAETEKKRTKGEGGDLSDPTAAVGYALWLLERPRMPGNGVRTGVPLA